MALASDDSPFWVTSNVEILFALKELRKARATLTCEIARSSESFTTEILDVDPRSGIVLDVPPSRAQMEDCVRAGKLVLRTTTAAVRIELELERVSVKDWEGTPALAAPVPARLLKIQRRNFFRVVVPKTRPIACTVSQPGAQSFAYPVLDIGLGGVALHARENDPQLTEGALYEKCRIALPDIGIIEPNIVIRHVATIRHVDQAVTYRFGCRFEKLPPAVEALIQRFVLQLERDRRAAALVDED